MIIRRATEQDMETIAAFNRAMAWETEQIRLDEDRTREGVKGLLAEARRGFYVLAEEEGQVLGQLMITYEWSDWRNGDFWWIQSVYVSPEHRGKGVYRRLHEAVEEEARQAGEVCGIRLYVEEHNHGAQGVYERMGMRKTAYLVFETDFVLRR